MPIYGRGRPHGQCWGRTSIITAEHNISHLGVQINKGKFTLCKVKIASGKVEEFDTFQVPRFPIRFRSGGTCNQPSILESSYQHMKTDKEIWAGREKLRARAAMANNFKWAMPMDTSSSAPRQYVSDNNVESAGSARARTETGK